MDKLYPAMQRKPYFLEEADCREFIKKYFTSRWMVFTLSPFKNFDNS